MVCCSHTHSCGESGGHTTQGRFLRSGPSPIAGAKRKSLLARSSIIQSYPGDCILKSGKIPLRVRISDHGSVPTCERISSFSICECKYESLLVRTTPAPAAYDNPSWHKSQQEGGRMHWAVPAFHVMCSCGPGGSDMAQGIHNSYVQIQVAIVSAAMPPAACCFPLSGPGGSGCFSPCR